MQNVFWLVEKEDLEKEKMLKPLLVATPDTGLISIIAAAHLVQSLNARLIGYVDADWIPPISIISNGDPMLPIRIYATNHVDILLSETPLLPAHWRKFAEITHSIASDLSSSLIIGAVGIPNLKRADITDISNLRIFYIGKYLESKNIRDVVRSVYESGTKFTGTLAGPYSALANIFIRNNMPFLYILVDSYPDYPDPEAAAKFIHELNKFMEINVDTKSLIEKGSEIRLMARQLALQTRRQQIAAGQKTGSPPVGMYV